MNKATNHQISTCKVISDPTENVKTFTSIQLPVHREIIVESEFALEVLSLHTLSAWVKHQIVDINIQGLF